jgi:hypothetical protein
MYNDTAVVNFFNSVVGRHLRVREYSVDPKFSDLVDFVDFHLKYYEFLLFLQTRQSG